MTDIIVMPDCPAPTDVTYTLISKATEMSGPLGGPTQRVLRIGSRFKLDFEFGPMSYGDARQWVVRLNRAEAAPIQIAFPQRGLNPGFPGLMVVDGSAPAPINSGGQLGVKSGTPGFELFDGQFFHVLSGGRLWLHQMVGDTTLDANGDATLGVVPALRFVPEDGDAFQWVTPKMEGFVTMGWNWSIAWINRIGLKFSVTEDR